MKEEKKGVKVEEKAEVSESAGDMGPTLTDKIRENPWVVATFVLGIVTLILLISNFGGMTGGAVGVISKEDASKNVLDFVKSQVGEDNVSLVQTNLKSGLYEVVISYQGRDIPIYMTTDGQNLVQGVTPFDQLMQQTNTDTTQQPANVPKSAKPVVELFVMSMCPYGTQAEKGLIPVVELLKSKIDFKLKFVSYSMHGKQEVDENTVQYCIQKQVPAKFTQYLRCYLQASDAAKWSACLTEAGINKATIDSCVKATDTQFKITELFNDKTTWSGGKYPQYNVNKEDNTKYGVQGSPTLVINGVESSAGRDSASYLAAICAAFNTTPSECSTQLSSTAPSPGFGWETTAAANTASTCG